MNKLIRYWNQNKKEILIVIAVIASIWAILHAVNELLGEGKSSNQVENTTNNSSLPSQSVITGQEVPETVTQNNIDVIEKFVNYGNIGDNDMAYSLLSNECKEEFNNDVNLFISNYCNKVFSTYKTYNLELWVSKSGIYTYEITYYENNLLATGGSTVNNNTQDYITVITENGETKLNINSFIYSEEINKTITQNNIEITINSRKVYKTYEKYNFTVKNSTANTISVSAKMNEEDICLVDENDAKYVSLIYEIPQHSLNIASGYQSIIELKFNKTYNTYREIEKISFQSIILNYEDYINNSDNDAEKIAINIPI